MLAIKRTLTFLIFFTAFFQLNAQEAKPHVQFNLGAGYYHLDHLQLPIELESIPFLHASLNISSGGDFFMEGFFNFSNYRSEFNFENKFMDYGATLGGYFFPTRSISPILSGFASIARLEKLNNNQDHQYINYGLQFGLRFWIGKNSGLEILSRFGETILYKIGDSEIKENQENRSLQTVLIRLCF